MSLPQRSIRIIAFQGHISQRTIRQAAIGSPLWMWKEGFETIRSSVAARREYTYCKCQPDMGPGDASAIDFATRPSAPPLVTDCQRRRPLKGVIKIHSIHHQNCLYHQHLPSKLSLFLSVSHNWETITLKCLTWFSLFSVRKKYIIIIIEMSYLSARGIFERLLQSKTDNLLITWITSKLYNQEYQALFLGQLFITYWFLSNSSKIHLWIEE